MTSLNVDDKLSLLSPSFDSFAYQLLKEWSVPGLALGIVKVGKDVQDTKIIFRNYGTAGRGREVDEDTLFCIASNSKAFTAAAVGHFVDSGAISWKDKMKTLLPGFGLKDTFATQQASLLDILSHRSGLPRHEHVYNVGDKAEQIVERLYGLRPSAEFRDEWQYNNLMYITASHLVSHLSQQPFTSFIASHFFEPLEMKSTTFTPLLDAPAIGERLSASYIALPEGGVTEVPFEFDLSFEDLQLDAGAGGIVSSTRDMIKWVEFLIRRRQGKEGEEGEDADESSPAAPILSRSSLKQLTSSHSLPERSASYPETSAITYGLGFMIHNVQGVEMIKHGGGMPGFGSQVLWSSRAGVGIVALTNVDKTGNAVSDIVSYRAMEELLGLEHVDWNARKRREYEKALASLAKHDPIKDDSPLPLDSYLGTYSHPSYGEIIVCPPEGSKVKPPSCSATYSRLHNAQHILSPPLSLSHTLYIPRPGFFGASHIVLSPAADSSPNCDAWTGAFAYYYAPSGERKHGLVAYSEHVRAEFAGEQLRLWGIWGAGPEGEEREERRRKDGGKRADAEVTFRRV